jgi:hypothetical protein
MDNHVIYILDHPLIVDSNIKFLNYIKKNQHILQQMKVNIGVNIVTNGFPNAFPVLVTSKKRYHGLNDILVVYESNIKAYNDFQIKNKTVENRSENKTVENIGENKTIENRNEINEENIHEYMKSNITGDTGDGELSIGDMGNNGMMDDYRYMIDKRSVKNPYTPKRSNDIYSDDAVESKNDIQDQLYKQLTNAKQHNMFENTQKNNERRDNIVFNSNNNFDKDDNILNKNIIDTDKSVKIDPSNIERGPEDDPQDLIMEKAYWNRISESD